MQQHDGLAVAGWMILFAAGVLGMTMLGDGPLAAPPVAEPGTWASWALSRPQLLAVFAVLRLMVLAIAWYLLAVTVIGLVLRLMRAGRLVALADLVTVPTVRRLLQGAVGFSLATAAVTPFGIVAMPVPAHALTVEATATPFGTTPGDPPLDDADVAATPSGTDSGDPSYGEAAVSGDPWSEDEATDMEHGRTGQDRGSWSVDGVAPPFPAHNPPPARPWVTRDPSPSTQPVVPETREWTVRSGEHFWSIATRILEESWQRPVTDQDIALYWKRLIDANREALADPGNPDLIYPGQVFIIPDPPAAAGRK